MDTRQFQWILAHELAHVRRRDYMVRWLEWLACVCFWWNPMVWWARHHLRVNEELCCDALVVSSLKPRPHTYADSLLTAVECLACPVVRVIHEMRSEGEDFKLDPRMREYFEEGVGLTDKQIELVEGLARRILHGLQDRSEAEMGAVGKKIRAAVEAGEITKEEGRAKMAGPRARAYLMPEYGLISEAL